MGIDGGALVVPVSYRVLTLGVLCTSRKAGDPGGRKVNYIPIMYEPVDQNITTYIRKSKHVNNFSAQPEVAKKKLAGNQEPQEPTLPQFLDTAWFFQIFKYK